VPLGLTFKYIASRHDERLEQKYGAIELVTYKSIKEQNNAI